MKIIYIIKLLKEDYLHFEGKNGKIWVKQVPSGVVLLLRIFFQDFFWIFKNGQK